MLPAAAGLEGVSPLPILPSPAQNAAIGEHVPLPRQVEAALWRGTELGGPVADVLTTGYPCLDAVLPGFGWPCGSVTEILVPQFSVVELRLLSPAIAALTQAGRAVALVGPPLDPHAPGMRHDRVDERQLVWTDVDTPRDRLWATEQLVKSKKCGAVVAWLPLVRPEQIRRLQVLASQCRGPVFLCRPEAAVRDWSAAPLRLLARYEVDWQIAIDVLKRKGPPLDERLHLMSVPGGISTIMTPRLRYYSRLRVRPSHVVVSHPAAPVRERSEVSAAPQP